MYFNTEQKLRLARSLITKTSPAYVQFYLTARCDLACEQCNIIYADADAKEMTLEQIRQVAYNLSKIGVCIVLFIGGEPFMRKDLSDIVKAFTDVNIHVRLQTNGLASSEALRRCVEAGAHDISISLDTLDGNLQDSINSGSGRSWDRAIETVSEVNRIFPENGTGFFGTVLMPRNLEHIEGVVKFATAIGWWVSLVPVHVTTPDNPRGFRSLDDEKACAFTEQQIPRVKEVLQRVKALRGKGYNVYDSDEYLDDIFNFVSGKPLEWRRRNIGICDSPNLYFAIEPNGNIRPCCDYKLDKPFQIYDPDFPERYWSGEIHREIYSYTRLCNGCMYGSYPEISVTARYFVPQMKRLLFFNTKTKSILKKVSSDEMKELANHILRENSQTVITNESNVKKIKVHQKKSKALRYLILRHLWKNRGQVEDEIYLEVVRSLSVSGDNGKFLISWTCNSNSFTKEMPEDEFSFYRQGKEAGNPEQSGLDETKNNSMAQEFAIEALGIRNTKQTNDIYNSVSIEPFSSAVFALNWIGCFILLGILGIRHWPVATALGIIMSLEFSRPKGKCLSAFLFTVFPFLGFPWVALIGSSIYSALQFLDPNPVYRRLRVSIPLMGGFIGLWYISYPVRALEFGPGIIVLFLICAFLTGYRAMLSTHFRSMPLVFPLIGAAFYLDGHPTAGWYIAIFSFVELAIRSSVNMGKPFKWLAK